MERQLIYYAYGFSCYISERENGTWSCMTPISGEHGFKTEKDAQEYSESYGAKDSRKTQNSEK